MHVVVIGGGAAGLSALNVLYKKVSNDSNISITLVEPKSFIEVPWASIRALFDLNTARNSVIPISSFLKKHPAITHVKAKVQTLESMAAVLDNSQRLEFDVCLLAVGASKVAHFLEPTNAPSFSDVEAKSVKGRLDDLEASGRSLLAAKSVLVVGGGAIGTEIASDIAGYGALQHGPKPKVTLVHSKEHLVPEFNKSSSAKILKMLQELGVTVYLNNKAVEKDGKWILESTGQEIEADTVIKAIGVFPQNDFMKSNFSGSLDEKGWITVDNHFRVANTGGRIFAVGDCCNSLAKTGVNAMGNKAVIATNIVKTLQALKGKENLDSVKNLATKVGGPPLFIVTAGPNKGVAQTPLGSLTWGLTGLKNKTMFIFRLKSEIGV